MDFDFWIVDVFTGESFGGNQLAVVTDATGMTTQQMQSVAREFGYSESTFVLPAKEPEHDAEVRIFTPAREVPFAGHPNVGTAYVISRLRHTEDGAYTLYFEERAGLVKVEVERRDGQVLSAELSAPEPFTSQPGPDAVLCARALEIDAADVEVSGHAPCTISVGLPFLAIELANYDALSSSRLSLDAGQQLLDGTGAIGVFLYTFDSTLDGVDIRARKYAPEQGITEDAATGSANAALAGLLAELDSAADATFNWTVAQGVEMGRASTIQLGADKSANQVTATRVGGQSALFARGTLTL